MSKAKKTRRGTLVIIASLLAMSAVLRISDGIAPALAREVETLMQDPAEPPVPAPDPDVLIAALQARDAKLKALEQSLLERQRTLDLAEEQIVLRLQELEATEASLRQTLTLAEEAAETDLSRLTTVYENMKPKEASELFETMDPEFAAGFLGRMRPDAAALVMAGLTPDSAYRISLVLAGRNANAPKE